jgi:uncharacterized membrane protein
MDSKSLITNDAVVAGILCGILLLVFHTSNSENRYWKKFYRFFPPILLCYFLPGLLNSFHIISGETSGVYPFVSKYLLPACLVYFTLSLDMKMLRMLGSKALFVFFAGSLGVIIGGPVAAFIIKSLYPSVFAGTGADEVWRGLATIAGSWIGGGANQTALKEVFQPSPNLFSQMVALDVIIAEIWLALLLVGVSYNDRINQWIKADPVMIHEIQEKLTADSMDKQKHPELYDYIKILAVGFVSTGLAYFLSDLITPFIKTNYPHLEQFSLTSGFFWVVSIVTLIGIALSRTSFRELEHVGASKISSLFLYILIASIGMQMNLFAIADNPGLLWIGIIWILIHALFVIAAAKLVRAPYFLIAVGSQANVGGAASASVVAAAFHSSLVTIGVMMAVLGYAIGTYGGYLTAMIIRWVTT